jgi:hypothetical protein
MSKQTYARQAIEVRTLGPTNARGARAVGDGLNAPVIGPAAPIENHLFDFERFGFFPDRLADLLGGFHVGAGFQRLL